MKTTKMHTTDWKYHTDEYGDECRTKIKYGYNYINGNNSSYVSITYESQVKNHRGRWVESSCGVVSKETVGELFPELLPLHRWHLASPVSGPMHYVANALYWHDWIHEKYTAEKSWDPTPEKAKENLKNQVVFGALETDSEFDIFNSSREELKDWLENRDLSSKLREDCDPINFD